MTTGSPVWILVLSVNLGWELCVSVAFCSWCGRQYKRCTGRGNSDMISIFLFLLVSLLFIILLSTSWRGDTLDFSFISTFITLLCLFIYVLNRFPSCRDVESVNWVQLEFRSRMEIHIMCDVCWRSIGIKRWTCYWMDDRTKRMFFVIILCPLFPLYLFVFMQLDAAVICTTSLHRQIEKWQHLSEPC